MSGDFELENLFPFDSAGVPRLGIASPGVLARTSAGSDRFINLADVGLAVGDIISASGRARNLVAAENSRISLRFYTAVDGGGSAVSTVSSAYIDTQTLTRRTIENQAIPATSVSMTLLLERQSGTGNIEGDRAMINRGASAADYAQPYQGGTYTPFPLWLAGFSSGIYQRAEIKAAFSPLGQRRVTQLFNNGETDSWAAVLRALELGFRDGRRLAAWASGVGLYGNVAALDPLHTAPGDPTDDRPVMANGRVNGGAQTGSAIATDGWPASTLIVSAGDWIQLGVEGHYYQVRADGTSTAGGALTIQIWPKLQASPADNAVVEVNYPHLHGQLVAMPDLEYIRKVNVKQMAFGIEEFL